MKITINNKQIELNEEKTILEVAKTIGINIPTLCHMNLHNIETLNSDAKCRVCVVEVEGRRNLAPACATYITDGMNIITNSKRAINARRKIVEMILSNHPKDCLICPKNGKCELQALAASLGIREIEYSGKETQYEIDNSSASIIRDKNKCIICGRCETICNDIQTVGVYSMTHRGFDSIMTTAFDENLTNTPCTFCGQCVSVCPTAALTEVDNTPNVWEILNDKSKTVIVQTAPAVRVALGEAFGMPVGSNVTGKMVTALRELGFNKVYDTNFAADLTVVEETRELIDRINNNGPLPILTSCCPAWVNFIEYHYPELLDIPSTCKSPQQMFGSIAKTYLADKLNIDPKNMIVVSIMPCLAKKYESNREELSPNKNIKDVDFVLSTRELFRMIKEAGINFTDLEDENFDTVMGESSGAATIFGVTGGVIESVVRNASKIIDKNNPKIDFKELRGTKGIKEATVTINNQKLNIAIVHGLGNARTLLENIKNGKSNYHAIEIMACPNGCIGGGGQPFYLTTNENTLHKRGETLYEIDKTKKIRTSIENKEIITLYNEFLGEIGGKKAHQLLHTKYKSKK